MNNLWAILCVHYTYTGKVHILPVHQDHTQIWISAARSAMIHKGLSKKNTTNIWDRGPTVKTWALSPWLQKRVLAAHFLSDVVVIHMRNPATPQHNVSRFHSSPRSAGNFSLNSESTVFLYIKINVGMWCPLCTNTIIALDELSEICYKEHAGDV